MSSKREIYKNRIDSIAKESFNNEQKIIAKHILDSVSANKLDEVYTLISQRVKTGFVFDAAPEVNHDAVAIVKENNDLFISSDSKSPNYVEHKLIIGENYDALKNLLVTYVDPLTNEGLIDFIYIDPPYGTEKAKEDGNDYKTKVTSNKFIYRDKFTRDGWLNMMNERLKLSKKLLSNEGFIFISIDDNNMSYLKVLMDDIFGEQNFIGVINVLDNLKGKSNDKFLSYVSHYVIVYSKNIDELGKLNSFFNDVPTDESFENKYKYLDERGYYTTNAFRKSGAAKLRADRPTMYFPILYKNSFILPSEEEYQNIFSDGKFNDDYCKYLTTKYERLGYKVIWPHVNKLKVRWTSSYDGTKELIKNNDLVFNRSGNIEQKKRPSRIEMVKQSIYGRPKNFVYMETFSEGTNQLKQILGHNTFNNPKSVDLIKYLISLLKNSKNLVVLDFFAGSGTTAQAVMELNAEDGGTRQCILVTNNENNIAKDITWERLYRIIHGKGSNNEQINWSYSKELPSLVNNEVRTFELKYYGLSVNDFEKANALTNKAHNEFKKLNYKYKDKKDIDIYNDLFSLQPIKKVT